ncbi:MAG: hypothetical protein LUC93_12480 [Planctomycetaceae bacterium]|nr:hypothetical protein [Planctomycetaceae bacterium]
MAKEARPLRHAAEYAAARAAMFSLSALPLPAAHWVGRRLGDLARVLDKRHRQRARDQVHERLGLDGTALDDFVKANFHNYGMTLAEFCRLSRMTNEEFLRRVDVDAFRERVYTLKAENTGMVLFTAHFGNWEWCNTAIRVIGVDSGSLARPLDNPRIDDMVRGIRERLGGPILDKKGAIRRAASILRKKGAVGVLPDQDGGRQGLMSPFLGKPASTITAPVELAVRFGCPMCVMGAMRVDEGERILRIVVQPAIHRPDPNADERAEVKRLVDAVNSDVSDMIMRAPEQWMWIHRRWKSVGEWQ